ncbi:hypothetical protein TNIN_166091 [Trichonephila inaurata madagascariensis]|uniref:Uncharacterized protein n=1 Tax=Trichonephila inaurata madagascariensis TaxID=2747483 RepID=A0A8X6WT16_9ARAC|nr:hypothetical protein TNIN_166091 [Trichonephila inaurata madagascariensis]
MTSVIVTRDLSTALLSSPNPKPRTLVANRLFRHGAIERQEKRPLETEIVVSYPDRNSILVVDTLVFTQPPTAEDGGWRDVNAFGFAVEANV